MTALPTKNQGGRRSCCSVYGSYTPQALNAMRENPNTNRQAAVEELLSAGGGKLLAMYGRATNGPGVMVIFDVDDPAMAPAITGVAVSSGAAQNIELTRLFTMEELPARERARQLRGVYKPFGSNNELSEGGILPPFATCTNTCCYAP